jgi:prophage DNA circulation protein
MSYQDRLRTCAYRSPSGAEFTLQFDDVERSGAKKAAIHELPQQSQPDVQDLGNAGTRFPLSAYFTGADYDQQADAFFKVLSEKGAGALGHPRWGNLAVLPLTWAQSESFVDGMGRADFSIEFIVAPETVAFPVTTVQTQQATVATAAAATDAAKADFVAGFKPTSAAEVANSKAGVLGAVQSVKDGFKSVVNGIDSATRELENQIATIEATVDELVAAPGQLFDSLLDLYNTVATLDVRVADKLTGYAAQMESLVAEIANIDPPFAYLRTAIASMANASAATATTVGPTRSRQEAVANADQVDAIRGAFQTVIEDNEAAVDGYQPEQTAVAAQVEAATMAAESVRQASFDLRSERRVIVQAETPALALLWQFYGNIDALDEFIESNDLQGDEILMVPAGREVVYYVG